MPTTLPSAREGHEREDVAIDLLDGVITFPELDGYVLHCGLPEDLRDGDITFYGGRIPVLRRLTGDPRPYVHTITRYINWRVTKVDDESLTVLGEHSYRSTVPVTFFRRPLMNAIQRAALRGLSERYNVPFNEAAFVRSFELPDGYVAGWIGKDRLYVGCSPEGDISS